MNNFPLLIRLDDINFPDIVTKTKSGGADIRFSTANDTNLPYEIEDWVDTSSGIIWVLVDTISNTSPTTIKMYYNNPIAISESDSTAVFSTLLDFQGVWHLNEVVTDEQTSGIHYDATANSNDGSQNGNNDATGMIALGQTFDGFNDLIDVGNGESLNITNQITLSSWINMTDDPGETNWYSIISKSNSAYEMYLYGQTSIATTLALDFDLSSGRADIYNKPGQDTNLSDLQWFHITVTFDGSNFYLYVNGVIEHIEPSVGIINSSSGIDVSLGGYISGGSNFWGILDEVRISSTARSADWVKLNYESQKSGQTLVMF